MLRVKHRRTAVDKVGDKDVSGSRQTKSKVPPEDLEFYDKEHGWRPVDKWEHGRDVEAPEDKAHHPGNEAKRVIAGREKEKQRRADAAKEASAESQKREAEIQEKKAEWHQKPEAERKKRAAELIASPTPIPGYSRLTPSWQEILGVNEKGEIQKSLLIKGANHAYIKRTPTGKPRPKYRYWYKTPSRKGLVESSDIKEGSKFKLTHDGQDGHFEVRAHHKDKGIVTVRHDESGRTIHMKQKDLHRMMQRQVAKKTRAELSKEPSEPKPLKLKRKQEQARLPGTEKKPAEPKKASPTLKRYSMDALGKGGFDQIEGFSHDVRDLEDQAHAQKGDGKRYAIIEQAHGYVLASQDKTIPTGEKIIGDKTTVLLRGTAQDIDEVDAEWAVVEADTLIPSHDPMSFTPQDAYPDDVQERPYHSDKGEQNKVDALARKLRPAMAANTNPGAIDGAPIVTESGVVLGGNGRTMGMQRAYRLYDDSAAKLRAHLASNARAFGIHPKSVEKMKNPILVRRVKAEGTKEMTRLGRRMNEALTQGLDPHAEQVAISKFVTKEVVDDLAFRMEPDQTLASFLSTSPSREFIRTLERAGIIDDRNKAQYVEKDESGGLLNKDGRERVARALAARMIPDSDLLNSMTQQWRENIAQSVPSLLQAEAAGWDLRPNLKRAVELDKDMQSKGMSRNDKDRKVFLAQLPMFDDVGRSKETEALLRILHDYGNQSKGMPQGFKELARAADSHQKDHGDQGGLFALDAPKEPADILNEAFPKKAKPERMAKSVAPGDLSRYVMRTVNWELENLMRGALVGADKGIDGKRILARLQRFIVDQAYQDKDFARGLGVVSLDKAVLRDMIAAHAKANVVEIAKSLARANLWKAIGK
jgi:hypothetical protein